MMNFRKATNSDLTSIQLILNSEGLPHEDCQGHLDNFLVLEEENTIIGVGGIELYGKFALIRSIAVLKEYRGKGIGLSIFSSIKQYAIDNGVTEMYLLTETAEDYFKKLSFSTISRDLTPEPIKQTKQFSSLCPSSAVVMQCILQ